MFASPSSRHCFQVPSCRQRRERGPPLTKRPARPISKPPPACKSFLIARILVPASSMDITAISLGRRLPFTAYPAASNRHSRQRRRPNAMQRPTLMASTSRASALLSPYTVTDGDLQRWGRITAPEQAAKISAVSRRCRSDRRKVSQRRPFSRATQSR